MDPFKINFVSSVCKRTKKSLNLICSLILFFKYYRPYKTDNNNNDNNVYYSNWNLWWTFVYLLERGFPSSCFWFLTWNIYAFNFFIFFDDLVQPPATLTWHINQEIADSRYVKSLSVLSSSSDGLIGSASQLFFYSESSHYHGGLLKITCLSDIILQYTVASEEVMIGGANDPSSSSSSDLFNRYRNSAHQMSKSKRSILVIPQKFNWFIHKQ